MPLRSFIDMCEKSRFNLFAASTHSASSQLIYKIGRYHEIGAMRTEKPYSKERTLVYWGGAEYLSPIQAIDETQLNLLDAAQDEE